MLMLIDTREPPGDDGGSAREPWLVTALAWLLPWPALIVWLCVASRLLDGWLAVGCIFAAIWLVCWRALRALPTEGLNQTRQ